MGFIITEEDCLKEQWVTTLAFWQRISTQMIFLIAKFKIIHQQQNAKPWPTTSICTKSLSQKDSHQISAYATKGQLSPEEIFHKLHKLFYMNTILKYVNKNKNEIFSRQTTRSQKNFRKSQDWLDSQKIKIYFVNKNIKKFLVKLQKVKKTVRKTSQYIKI